MKYVVTIDQRADEADIPDNAVKLEIDNLLDMETSFKFLVDSIMGFGGVGSRITITKVSDERPTKTDFQKSLDSFRSSPIITLTGGATSGSDS